MIFGLYHNAQETAGMITDVLKELNIPFKPVHLYKGEGFPRNTSDLEGLVVMGGPMNVDDVGTYPFLLDEVQLLEKVLAEDKPVLGICLGAQLIAKALGCKVYPNPAKEVGWHPIRFTPAASADPFFETFPKSLTVLQWHGDTFDLPKGAALLASSARCRNQAFRWGSATYGLQFHLEVTPAMVKQWCSSKDGLADIKAAGEDPDAILNSTNAATTQLAPMARNFFSSYFKSVYSKLLVA